MAARARPWPMAETATTTGTNEHLVRHHRGARSKLQLVCFESYANYAATVIERQYRKNTMRLSHLS